MIRAWIRMFVNNINGAGHAINLIFQTAFWTHAVWKKRDEIVRQIAVCAFGGFPVAMVVGVFSGMVLALQGGIEFTRWGQEELIGYVVPASMVREMGPVMTGYILSGLIGSTMAAELGTMAVSEEIEALEVMSINPVYFLVMPRIIALALVAPLLTIYVDLVGIIGGGIVGERLFNLSLDVYFYNARESLGLKDIYSGLFKALVFGTMIACVGCSQGIRATGGAEGVGRATMRTVVIAFVFVLIFDYMLTWMFY